LRSATKHALREAMQWGTLALGIVAAVYFFDDLKAVFTPANLSLSRANLAMGKAERAPGFSGEVRLRGDRRGHFIFKGAVDDRSLTFMADTGASIVVLTYDGAKQAGLSPHNLDFSAHAQTANGVARVAPVTLDRVRVGDITVRNVRAAVAEKGMLSTNLLGMSFLGRLKSFHIQDGELVLIQ
jgi:aspartyl protease family protein